MQLSVEEEIGSKRVYNDFGFVIPEVLFKIVCYEVNLILEAIFLVFASRFTAYYFVATIMNTPAKTSVKASPHTREIINGIFQWLLSPFIPNSQVVICLTVIPRTAFKDVRLTDHALLMPVNHNSVQW